MPCSKVVHCKHHDYDIYIGRGKCPKTGAIGIYGNPFSSKPSFYPVIIVKSATEAVKCFDAWLTGDLRYARIEPERREQILATLSQLTGKVLGCWCNEGYPCHGHVYIRYAN